MMWRHLLAVVFAGALSLGSVHAQSVTGRISGTVRDSSNAVVPGASVTVTNQATQIARTARTDVGGFRHSNPRHLSAAPRYDGELTCRFSQREAQRNLA